MSTRTEQTATGLPETLPDGEVVLWQGKPAWRSLALRAFHIRKVGIYFGLILAWRAGLSLYEQSSLASVASDALPLVLLALGSIGMLALLAWLYARSTAYTITNRRVFMRFGAALPMMLNLPFRIVGSASAVVHRDGTADIPLQLLGPGRVAYLHLWPFARPWRLTHPEPMLRSVGDGARVVALLASALTDAAPPPAAASQAIGKMPSERAADSTVPDLTPVAA